MQGVWFAFWVISPIIALVLAVVVPPIGVPCVIAASIVAYFLPAIVANRRRHHNFRGLLILNILLGWTLIGWVAAAVWAYSKTEGTEPSEVAAARPTPAWAQTEPERVAASANTLRHCPFCAEEIKAIAVKCKHCGSVVEPLAAAATGPKVHRLRAAGTDDFVG